MVVFKTGAKLKVKSDGDVELEMVIHYWNWSTWNRFWQCSSENGTSNDDSKLQQQLHGLKLLVINLQWLMNKLVMVVIQVTLKILKWVVKIKTITFLRVVLQDPNLGSGTVHTFME